VNDPVELHVASAYLGAPPAGGLEADPSTLTTQAVEWANRDVMLPPGLIERCRQIYLSASPSGAAQVGVIGVTSAWAREGRTSVALGMAAALAADSSDQTLLVECDFEQIPLARIVGAPSNRGLADWLDGTTSPPLVQTASLDNLVVLCAGASFVNPTRAIHRLVQSGLVEELRSRFRNVVLDLPPLLGVPYGTLAARLADRLVLVVRQGVTPIDDVERSIGLVGRERIAGLVLNAEVVKTPRWLRRLM